MLTVCMTLFPRYTDKEQDQILTKYINTNSLSRGDFSFIIELQKLIY